jgi:hypothetical protein
MILSVGYLAPKAPPMCDFGMAKSNPCTERHKHEHELYLATMAPERVFPVDLGEYCAQLGSIAWGGPGHTRSLDVMQHTLIFQKPHCFEQRLLQCLCKHSLDWPCLQALVCTRPK